jgi:UbiA prenyltransferase family protein
VSAQTETGSKDQAPLNAPPTTDSSGRQRSISLAERAHTLLVLGRISNLPTVWSNCLAAWILGGGGSWQRFWLVCLGATLLYTGGMFLNDAFDVEFDRQHRPERPIVSGRIRAGTVWCIGGGSLVLGAMVLILLGSRWVAFTAALAGCIIIYNAVHKRTAFAPVLMAGCRFLLYLVAATAATEGVGRPVLWRAAALGLYILGLSFLARVESRPGVVGRWPIGLLLAPVVIALCTSKFGSAGNWIAGLALVLWLVWCLRGRPAVFKRYVNSGVAGLLAGIVLVDWLAIAPVGPALAAGFVGMFLLALLLQRIAPAT